MQHLTVSAAAPDTLLTTLVVVKGELGISAADYDDLLTRYILEASAAISKYTDRAWARQTYIEKVGGYGTTELLLSRSPIQGTPSEVLYDSTAVTDFEVGDREVGTLYRRLGWRWTAPVSAGGIDPWKGGRALPLFQVTYEAGYTLPGWDTANPRDLPENVERACIETVKDWYKSRSRSGDLKKKKVDDLELTYHDTERDDESGLPMRAAALLKRELF